MNAQYLNQGLIDCLCQQLAPIRNLGSRERVISSISVLKDLGLLERKFIREAVAPRTGAPLMFSVLVALGRSDLSVARLYEGHVNALQLVARYGTFEQLARAAGCAAAGGMLGVWGADHSMSPATITPSGGAYCLGGKKTFASGSGGVALALVTVKSDDGRSQLVLLPQSILKSRFDPSRWRPLGMVATDSFTLDLGGIHVEQDSLVGYPDNFLEQPFFGAGHIRCVAAQLGGALAVWDATRDHLAVSGRVKDPHQASRLGAIVADLEAAFSCVREAYWRVARAIAWDAARDDPATSLCADSARAAVEGMSDRICALAVRSVGCAGLMESHPLSRGVRDLMVYLRQPAPDAALTRLGTNAGLRDYRPNFDAA